MQAARCIYQLLPEKCVIYFATEIKRNSSESFDFNTSRKDCLDEAALLEYDGKNMPFIMFKNQIINLRNKCPYDDRKLPLLRAPCVRKASQTIAIVISDSPVLNSTAKIKMALDRLSQRFGGRVVKVPSL